jgi:hypothetical protein
VKKLGNSTIKGVNRARELGIGFIGWDGKWQVLECVHMERSRRDG